MRILLAFLFCSSLSSFSADPVSQKAIHDCYSGYIGVKYKFHAQAEKDHYAPNQASGITLCRVLIEHDDRNPAYDWTFQSIKDVIPDIDQLRSTLESKEGVCKIGGILYLKKFHRTRLSEGLKVLENHCR